MYFYTVLSAEIIYARLEERRKQLELSQAEVSQRAFGQRSNAALQNIRRGALPSVEKLDALARALGITFSIGAASESTMHGGLAKKEPDVIEPSLDGSIDPLQTGFIPIPYSNYEKRNKGFGPIALSRAWIADKGIAPDKLTLIIAPDHNMAPLIGEDDLLLVDSGQRLSKSASLSAFTLDGSLGLGWTVMPKEDSVVVFYERRFSNALVLRPPMFGRYNHIGQIVGRFDDRPIPWVSNHERTDLLRQAKSLLDEEQ